MKLGEDFEPGETLQDAQPERRAADASTRKTQGGALLAEVVNRLVQRRESARFLSGAAERPVQTLVLLG